MDMEKGQMKPGLSSVQLFPKLFLTHSPILPAYAQIIRFCAWPGLEPVLHTCEDAYPPQMSEKNQIGLNQILLESQKSSWGPWQD